MNDVKIIAMFVIILALFGLYLDYTDKLFPFLTASLSSDNPSSVSPQSLGEFVVAFVLYLFVLSLLNPNDGLLLSVIIVLGALLINFRNKGSDSVILQLFGH